MKTAYALVAASVVASSEAFTVTDGSARVSTELYKYRPTKWSPQGGVSPYGSVAPSTSAAAVVEEEPAAALSYGGMPAAVATGPKTNYAPTKWSPQGGSAPGFSGPVATEEAPAAAAPAAPAGPTMADLAAQWAMINSDKN